jgi:four helix bundle protein
MTGEEHMPFKFEKLEVWQLALDYIDATYDLATQLPRSEEYNLRSQIIRAATSIALNIAEGSTGQTDAEQSRFIGLALRSLVETVACQHLILRRKLTPNPEPVRALYMQADHLAAKLQAFRRAISPDPNWLREPPGPYAADTFEPDDSTRLPPSPANE